MATDVRLICWPTPERPAIGLQLRNFAGQAHTKMEELIQLDTGYSEELLVPYRVFRTLQLDRWGLPQTPSGTTITGQVIQVHEARAEVHMPQTGERHRVIVQTFVGNTRFLIGRAFLRRFKVILDGPGRQTCLMMSSST